MAVGAFVGSVFVEDDEPIADRPGLCMALRAGDVGVASGQGEVRAGVVIEDGRNPSVGVVAIGAVGFAVFRDKLRIVRVEVASFALLRSAFET